MGWPVRPLGALAVAALCWTGCASSPTPDERSAELKDAAKPLLSNVVVEVHAREDSAGMVKWEVACDDTADAAASPRADEASRRTARARSLNAALIDIATKHGRRGFDPETMVAAEVEFRQGSDRAYTQVASFNFRGSRLWHAHGAGELEADPERAVAGVSAEIEVVPDKPILAEGQPVAGVVRIRNTGSRPLVIPWSYMPNVAAVDSAGKPAPSFSTGGFCGGTGGGSDPEPLILAPGGSIRRPFRINTDPLGSGGSILDPGRFRLECNGFGNYLNIASRVVPAPIEVRRGNERPLGSRIVRLAASERTVSVTRADGRFEIHDLRDGRVVAAARPAGYSRSTQDHDQWRWSPDGSIAVRTFCTDRGTREARVAVLRPGGSPRLQSFVIPIEDAWLMGARVAGFSPDAREVQIELSDVKATTLRPADGTWHEREYGTHPSPDGRFLLTEGALTATPANGGSTYVAPFEAERGSSPLEGVLGWYIAADERSGVPSGDPPGADRHGEVAFASYDGSGQRTLVTTATTIIGDSADGRFVALSNEDWGFRYGGSAGRLEVWNVTDGRHVMTIDDGRSREAVFAGRDLLVCAPRVRSGSGVCFIDDALEVYDLSSGRRVRTIRLEESAPETATDPTGPT